MRLFYCIHVWPDVSKLPGPLSIGQPVDGFIQTVSAAGEPYEGAGDDNSASTVADACEGRDPPNQSSSDELVCRPGEWRLGATTDAVGSRPRQIEQNLPKAAIA